MSIAIKKEGWAIFTAEIGFDGSQVTNIFASAIPSDMSSCDFAKMLGYNEESSGSAFMDEDIIFMSYSDLKNILADGWEPFSSERVIGSDKIVITFRIKASYRPV